MRKTKQKMQDKDDTPTLQHIMEDNESSSAGL